MSLFSLSAALSTLAPPSATRCQLIHGGYGPVISSSSAATHLRNRTLGGQSYCTNRNLQLHKQAPRSRTLLISKADCSLAHLPQGSRVGISHSGLSRLCRRPFRDRSSPLFLDPVPIIVRSKPSPKGRLTPCPALGPVCPAIHSQAKKVILFASFFPLFSFHFLTLAFSPLAGHHHHHPSSTNNAKNPLSISEPRRFLSLPLFY